MGGSALCSGKELFDSAKTHGELMEARCCLSMGGVVAPLCGLRGGDFVNFDEPLPCELRDSSPLRVLLSSSLDRSLSLSSLTASLDFFLTRPAASRAVVARCIMLTLPERGLRFLDSRSLTEVAGVTGCERMELSAVDEGESRGVFVGVGGRGGVEGLTEVGVGGTKVS